MLPAEYADIGDDVKESFLRSTDLKNSLGRITMDIGTNNFHRVAPASAKAVSHYRPAFKAGSHSPVARHTGEHSKSPLSKHAGKATLNTRLQLFNQRLVLTKAGKPVAALSEECCGSPVLDRVAQMRTPQASSGPEASTHTLPHVSLLSGKVKQALQLPTYMDYCITHKVDFKGPANDRVLRHAKEAIDRLEKLKRHINGLAILLEATPGTPWNRDKKVLYKLDKYPAQRGAILKVYSGLLEPERKSLALEQKTAEKAEERKAEVFIPKRKSKTPPPVRSGQEAYRLIRQRADDFTASQLHQNQRLIDILDRYEVERPFLIQRKTRLIAKDNERFRDIGHALQRFHEYRKEADDARSQRVEMARGQVVLYERLLEYLKAQETQPTQTQLLCLDIVRGLLEEGWAVDREVVGWLREAAGDTSDAQGLLQLLEEGACS